MLRTRPFASLGTECHADERLSLGFEGDLEGDCVPIGASGGTTRGRNRACKIGSSAARSSSNKSSGLAFTGWGRGECGPVFGCSGAWGRTAWFFLQTAESKRMLSRARNQIWHELTSSITIISQLYHYENHRSLRNTICDTIACATADHNSTSKTSPDWAQWPLGSIRTLWEPVWTCQKAK